MIGLLQTFAYQHITLVAFTLKFFQLLSEELFDVHSGLWSNKYGDELNWFNADNTWDEKGYEMIGVLFGLALYNSVLLDVRFPLAVYRKIVSSQTNSI